MNINDDYLISQWELSCQFLEWDSAVSSLGYFTLRPPGPIDFVLQWWETTQLHYHHIVIRFLMDSLVGSARLAECTARCCACMRFGTGTCNLHAIWQYICMIYDMTYIYIMSKRYTVSLTNPWTCLQILHVSQSTMSFSGVTLG